MTASLQLQRCGAVGLFVLVQVSLVGCFDHRRAVAFRTLVTDQGAFHQEAYSAALEARFSPGTRFDLLRQYVIDNGGRCHEKQEGTIWCEIALRGHICQAELAGIEVTLDGEAIKTLNAIIGGLGC